MPKGVYKKTKEHKLKIALTVIGKKRHWKGDKVGIGGIFAWLKRTYGKADKCENPKCPKTSQKYGWFLKKKMEYRRRRKNYWRLCYSCHKRRVTW